MVLPTRFVVILLATVMACHHDLDTSPKPTAVKVAAVAHAKAPANTHYSGQINPATRLELSFKVSGYVESIATVPGVDGKPRVLQEGDAVQASMPLATLRRVDYAQRLAEAKAAAAHSKVVFDQASIDYQRAITLVEQNAVSRVDLDAARTRRDTAEAAMSGVRAQLDQTETVLSDTVLRSPLTGIVLKRTVEIGTLAAPGTLAFVIADVKSVKVAFGVPDVVLPRIKLGAALTITTEAYPGEKFRGQISLIAPSADSRSRVFEVDVTIGNADGRLKPGTVATLALDDVGDGAGATLLVPLSAIVRAPKNPTHFAVFVVDASTGRAVALAREIELDECFGARIPVKSGLVGDETIVVQGAGLLSEGEPVEVIR